MGRVIQINAQLNIMKNILEIPKEAKHATLVWCDHNNDTWSVPVYGNLSMFETATTLYSAFLARLQQVENLIVDSNDELRDDMIVVLQELRRAFEYNSLEDMYEHMLSITKSFVNE